MIVFGYPAYRTLYRKKEVSLGRSWRRKIGSGPYGTEGRAGAIVSGVPCMRGGLVCCGIREYSGTSGSDKIAKLDAIKPSKERQKGQKKGPFLFPVGIKYNKIKQFNCSR